MKLLFMIGSCVCSSAIFAQYKNPQVYKYDAFRHDTTLQLRMFPPVGNQVQRGVYQLPLDKMPCVVPDVRASIAIPNAWGGAVVIPFYSRIPNPALPKLDQREKSLKTN
jgi:hypothetical protein